MTRDEQDLLIGRLLLALDPIDCLARLSCQAFTSSKYRRRHHAAFAQRISVLAQLLNLMGLLLLLQFLHQCTKYPRQK